MDTLTLTNEAKTEQKINLIDGSFTASEASDIINNILKVKINFHKLQSISLLEGNVNDPCEFDNSRIHELLNEQKIAKEFFKNVRLNGKKLKINSTIHISLED
jgi:uncharacterized protein with FMN-binding domain